MCSAIITNCNNNNNTTNKVTFVSPTSLNRAQRNIKTKRLVNLRIKLCTVALYAVVDRQAYIGTFSNIRMIWSNTKMNYVPKSQTSYNDSRKCNFYTDSINSSKQ